MKLLRIGLVGLTVLVLLVLFLGRSLLYVVTERDMAVVLQFGEPVATRTEPGLYFKLPFVQEVMRLPKTYQLWTVRPNEILVDLPTADGKKLEVTPWAVWRITDPAQFVRVLRTVDKAQTRVRDIVRAEVRDAITSAALADAVRTSNRKLTYSFQVELPESPPAGGKDGRPAPVATPALQPLGPVEGVTLGRKGLIERIKTRVHNRIAEVEEGGQKGRGIEVVDVGIARIEFVAIVREAAFDRLIAFMESIASRHVSEGERRRQEILNRTEAEVQRILGEGSEEANTIRGQVEADVINAYAQAIRQTGEFYDFVRSLEAYEAAFQGKTRLILTTDHPFLEMMRSPDIIDKKK